MTFNIPADRKVPHQMPRPDYVITTRLCTVPHVADPSCVKSLSKTVKIYVDDVLYKDSAYDKGLGMTIKEFCSISGKVCVGFKNKPKVLVSKRGHYRLCRKRYEEVMKVLCADYHADFDSGKIVVNGLEEVEPSDVEELVRLVNGGHMLFGTGFVHGLVENGLMMRFVCGSLSVNKIFDCSCCGDLSPGYLRYLWGIKEMNAYTYLTVHNYNVLEEMMEFVGEGRSRGSGEVTLEQRTEDEE